MTSLLELACGALRCELRPDLGGCIAGLWLGDVPVLRSTPARSLESVRLSGSYPLVPFSNRVGQARLLWAGTSHPLVQSNTAEPHAIHGVGWQRPWEVLDASEQFALLSYEHKADAAWPFAFDSSQAFRLSEGELVMTLSVTNQAAGPAPAGLGWHPYFTKHPGSHIAFQAGGRWEMGADKLPTHRVASSGLDADCAALEVDHCFDEWRGEARLHNDYLRIRVSSNLSRLVVYTSSSRDFVAIEPVSHVNDAANLMAKHGLSAEALGLRVLQPGESMSAEMSIRVAAAA
jgi:aldose 1-epimerase